MNKMYRRRHFQWSCVADYSISETFQNSPWQAHSRTLQYAGTGCYLWGIIAQYGAGVILSENSIQKAKQASVCWER